MAIIAKIGIYQDENGAHVQYSGKKGELLELLALLQAHYLKEVTDKPEQFQEAFKRIQTETASKYITIKAEELKNKQEPKQKETFLGEEI